MLVSSTIVRPYSAAQQQIGYMERSLKIDALPLDPGCLTRPYTHHPASVPLSADADTAMKCNIQRRHPAASLTPTLQVQWLGPAPPSAHRQSASPR